MPIYVKSMVALTLLRHWLVPTQCKGRHGFYIDKGHEAENLQKECLFLLHLKISFWKFEYKSSQNDLLWGPEYGVYTVASYLTICHILLWLFCIWTSYLSHSDCLLLILKFYTVPLCLHAVKRLPNQDLTQLYGFDTEPDLNQIMRCFLGSFRTVVIHLYVSKDRFKYLIPDSLPFFNLY